MTIKLIAGVIFIFAAMVVLFSGNRSDLLFLFVANNEFTNIGRLLAALVLLALSFGGSIGNYHLRKSLGIFGLAVAALAGYALFNPVWEGILYNYLKPLDLLLAVEMGIAFSLISFSAGDMPAQQESAKLSRKSSVLAHAK